MSRHDRTSDRCPVHGTLLIVDSKRAWCWPCGQDDGARLSKERTEGACLAMSRLLVWAWCEMEAQCWKEGWSNRTTPVGLDRRGSFAEAIDGGLFRLEWGGKR